MPKISYEYESLNKSPRIQDIKYIILHYTEMTFSAAVQRLCAAEHKVSAHYIIRDDGQIFQLVNDTEVAWHAGKSYWQGQESLNQNSLGIELDNLGDREFTKQQYESCIELCKFLMNKYNIIPKNVIGHSDIAPERKIDPGIFFDWRLLAAENIGIPISHVDLDNRKATNVNITEAQQILKNIGYKIEVTNVLDKQTNFVLRAFLSHFCPEIIHKKGIEYYNNPDSIYELDSIVMEIIGNVGLGNVATDF